MPLALTILSILFITTLIFISAIFSALETSYSSITMVDIEKKLLKDNLTKKIVIKHYNTFGRTLSTILIGNNIVNIIASTSLPLIISSLILDSTLNVIISTAVLSPIIIIFGEILPKIFARKYSIQYIKFASWFLEIFYYLFYPFTFLVAKLFKNPTVTHTEKDLRTIIKLGKKEGILENYEAQLAINALDMDSTKVTKHYVRLKNIDFVNWDDDISIVKKKFEETGFSRLPIKKKNKFIGIIILKNIFNKESGIAADYSVDTPSISSNALLTKALQKMREEKSQFLFVTKNSRTILPLGIITFEDILEELIGEIYDESDEFEGIHQLNLKQAIVSIDIKISKINEVLKFKLPYEELTLESWILFHKPNKDINMKFIYNHEKKYIFKTVENKRNSIAKILITQL